MTTPLCPSCSAQTRPFFIKDGFPYAACPSCQLVMVYPQPAPDFLKEEVYSAKSGYQGNRVVDLASAVPSRKRKKVLAYLRDRLAAAPQAGGSGSAAGIRLLDIGCSNGELMFQAQALGYQPVGVELNAKTANNARAHGLTVFGGFLSEAGFAEKSFDVIHLGDLIEHVNDPAGLAAECRKLLAPGGVLIVITPNLDCFWSRSTYLLYKFFRIPWSSCTPPHHLFQFSDRNLRMLLERAGFAAGRVWYDRVSSLRYELGSLHLLKRWKQQRTAGRLAFMVFSFAAYAVLFGLNRCVECLPVKRASVTQICISP